MKTKLKQIFRQGPPPSRPQTLKKEKTKKKEKNNNNKVNSARGEKTLNKKKTTRDQ